MKRLYCSVVLGLLTLILAACGGLAGEPAIVATLPATPTVAAREISLPQYAPDLALGANIYAANCTRCHGAGGKGDGELVQAGQVTGVPDFTDAQTARNDTPLAWYEIVTNGRLEKLMPPWGDKLSDAERWAVAVYVYTLATTSDQIAQGQIVWADKCVECHGETGAGTSKGAPLPDLLNVSTTDALTALAEGIPDKMPSFAADLTLDQRTAVIAYARTLRVTSQQVEVAQAATQGAIVEPLSTPEVIAPVSTQEVGAPSSTGTVSGKITNGTAGGVVPADLPLNLHVLSADGQSVTQTFTGQAGVDGSFLFADVPYAAGLQYVVTTSYENAVFTSEVVTGDPANPQLDLPLTVYEVTDDPASISVNGWLVMLQTDVSPGQLGVVQIVSFSNTSDRVFLRSSGDTPTSVAVHLPAGASYEDFSSGSYVISADGSQVSDTNAVLPGDSHVMHIGYTVPFSGTARLTQVLDYPLDGSVEIMAPGGASVSGSGISAVGTRQMGSQNYTSFGGTFTRAAGDSLQFEVSVASAPQTTTVPAGGISVVAYILIGVGLLAIGAAFGFFMRERTSAPAAAALSVPEDMNTLVKQIADLDVRYHEGKLAEAKYQAQRQKLKARLARQMKAAASDESSGDA